MSCRCLSLICVVLLASGCSNPFLDSGCGLLPGDLPTRITLSGSADTDRPLPCTEAEAVAYEKAWLTEVGEVDRGRDAYACLIKEARTECHEDGNAYRCETRHSMFRDAETGEPAPVHAMIPRGQCDPPPR